MSEAAISCPKCRCEMVQGYVRERTPLGIRVSEWNAGPPREAGLGGHLLKDSPSVIPIVTFRCRSCGFLESYAREEDAAQEL